MGEDLNPIEAFIFIDANTSIDEMLHIRANFNRLWNNHFSSQNLFPEAFQTVMGEVPRDLTNKHFVYDDAEWPNIAFVRIFFLFENLGSHVSRSPHQCFQHASTAGKIFGESEITNF